MRWGNQTTTETIQLHGALGASSAPPEYRVSFPSAAVTSAFEVSFETQAELIPIDVHDPRKAVFLIRDLHLESGPIRAEPSLPGAG